MGEQLYMLPLTGKIKTHDFAVYDIETLPTLEQCYLVGFYDGKDYIYFESEPMRPELPGSAVDQFMRWILSKGTKYQKYRIYAHNGGNFDDLYIMRWLLANAGYDYKFTVIPLQSSILILDIRSNLHSEKSNIKWTFIDSLRLMKASLEQLCKSFEIPGKVKDKDEFGNDKPIDYETLHQNPLRYEYLRQDCLALYQCLSKFHGIIHNMGGSVGVTAPSTAMDTFRRSFQSHPIAINRHFPECEDPACHGCLHDFVRRGYYGGRVERYRKSFDVGTDSPEPAYAGDFNSLYPSVMLEPVPCELAMTKKGPLDVEKYNQFWLGFVECTVVVPLDCYLPVLPYRTQGKLLFPVGTFQGVWTSAELVAAFKQGTRILDYGKSVWFRGKAIFKGFVETLYAYRDKSSPDYDEALSDVAKDIMVSLYGKMGMKESREKLWFFPDNDEALEHQLNPLGKLGEGIFNEEIKIAATYVIPHIAAWVCALGRLKLHGRMQGMLDALFKLYYGDTDSIDTTAPITNNDKLGELKLVGRIKRASYIAPKFYLREFVDGTEIKAKGFSGGFKRKRLNEEEFNRIVQHREKVVISRMRKYREGLRSKEYFPSMMDVPKGITGIDSKRILLPDGNTRPVIIGKDIEA